MGNAGRFWTAWLAIVAIASAGGAAPQNDAGAAKESAPPEPLATVPAEGPLDPEQDRFSRELGKATVNTLDATMKANGVVPSVAYETAPQWITVMGNVRDAGSHELESKTITLGELLARCGGPEELANYALHLVRDGQPWGPVVSHDEALYPGDLVVIQSLGTRPTDNKIVLGLVGLEEAPVAVEIPAKSATIAEILERTRQTHLSAADVTALVDGARAVPMDATSRLPDCTVLVFDPARINRNQLPELPTNRFGLAKEGEIVLAGQGRPDGPADVPQQRVNAAPPGHVTLSATLGESADLSDLPPVQPLAPPPLDDAPPFEGAPQTADASGQVTIGPPELESHIVQYPSEEFLPPTENSRMAAAPDPPATSPVRPGGADPQPPETNEPVGLPANELDDLDDTERSGEDSQDWDLWPVALMGMLLGGGTFYLIWRLSDEATRAALGERVRSVLPRRNGKDNKEQVDISERETTEFALPTALREPIERPSLQEPEEIPATVPLPIRDSTPNGAPADLLAALAANRLPFRVEPVELPKGLFVQGRSTAPARRRVDAGRDEIRQPHIYQEDGTTESGATHPDRGPVRENGMDSDDDDDRLFDPAEAISGPTAARQFGTPFEQALAKLRAST